MEQEESAFYYVLHGTGVRINRPTSALPPSSELSAPALDIWLGSFDALRWRRSELNWGGLEERLASPLLLERQDTVYGDCVFYCTSNPQLQLFAILLPAGNTVEVGWRSNTDIPAANLERVIADYLLPGLVGMALRLSGRSIMHGNVVEVNGNAIAWLGDKGAGKSTLAAAFVAADYPLLADDQFAVWLQDEPPGIAPGIRRLHLWPESFGVLAEHGDRYHLHQPFSVFPKGYVTVNPDGDSFANFGRRPLQAIYVLQHRGSEIGRPYVETPSAGMQLHLLLTHCFARKTLPVDTAQQRAEFQMAGELARRVPLRLLRLPDDLARLPEMVEMLVDDHA